MKNKRSIFCITVSICCAGLLLIGAGVKKSPSSKAKAEQTTNLEYAQTEINNSLNTKCTVLELTPDNLEGAGAVFSDISDTELNSQLERKKAILNSAVLSPTKTNHLILDNLIAQRFSQNLKALPDTFSQAKFCYDWLLQNSKFGGGTVNMQDMCVFLDDCDYCGTDGMVVYDAYRMLLTGQGVCDNYASALTVLFRYIGLDAYIVHGKAQLANGTTSNHVWVTVQINGIFYWFDPQIEAAASASRQCVYALFCANPESLPFYTAYNLDDSCNAYHGFHLCKPLQVVCGVGGKSVEPIVYHPGEVNAYGDVVKEGTLNSEDLGAEIPIELTICGGTAPYQCKVRTEYTLNGNKIADDLLEKTQTFGCISTVWKPPTGADNSSIVVQIRDSEGRSLVLVLA